MIPALNKTSQGAILFKSPIIEKQPQKDGIYIRNDRNQSNTKTTTTATTNTNTTTMNSQQNTNIDKHVDEGKL